MKNLTLVVLAAGMGSRYGGLKQLEGFGPSGEILTDYSFHDAILAGFDKIVCVIRKDMEEVFYDRVTKRWEKFIDIEHVYQDLNDLPAGYRGDHRKKPWGTAHAILAARNAVNGSFTVINADDFYGRTSYSILAEFLKNHPQEQALVSFVLENTLSPHGKVSRGVCQMDSQGFLQEIVEREGIKSIEEKIICNDRNCEISRESLVSMNFWGFSNDIFSLLQQELLGFLEEHAQSPDKECYIPTAIDNLIKSGQISVHVLKSKEKWMGVTYSEDKKHVEKSILNLVQQGKYSSNLWGNLPARS